MSNEQKYGKSNIIAIVTLLIAIIVGIIFTLDLTSENAVAADIVVYKSPTCGCCKKWVSYLEKEGFSVEAHNVRDMTKVKKEFQVHPRYQSCHTAKVGKYFIEGHVSASDIRRLMKEQPDIKGLSVPGMPMGSPGMEGFRKDKYDVIAIDKDNKRTVYSSH